MADVKVGKITHYFDRIGVGIVGVSKALKVGDTIKIVGHGNKFTQSVDSMQLDHQVIQSAKKGQSIGLKVTQKVKEGDEVYKL
ncbi:hypothetical protein HYW87_02990 [Candidatus Roizmanbacteria bacterium]|nr:hypothetical protein [Candidatus Roizmanbacteria bacterium]